MSDNVDYLPVWKKNNTAEERFLELAMIARKHPERFNRICVIYEENKGDDTTVTDYTLHNCSTLELLGLIEIAKQEIFAVVRKK